MVTCRMAAADAAFAHLTVAGGSCRLRAGRVARKGSDRTAVKVVMAYWERVLLILHESQEISIMLTNAR